MTRRLLIVPLIALGLVAAPAGASFARAAAPATPEASIPFANHGGIRDWRETGDRTLYIQDSARHWYRATLMTSAFDLPYTTAIGFDTGPTDRLDKFSSVVVRGQRYAIQSLMRVDGPPPPRQHKHR